MPSIIPQIEINDQDLNKKKYSIEILENNINNLTITKILRTQKLTPEFCVKYILNDDYACCVEETYICDLDVLRYQPHIKHSDLQNARLNLLDDMV